MKRKIQVFHALLAHMGLMRSKYDLLAGYGVESTTMLTEGELDDLIGRLRGMQKESDQVADERMRKLRSQVLTDLNKIGIYTHNGDWGRVNNYLKQPKICGKLLYECDEDELKRLHRKLMAIGEKQSRQELHTRRLTREN
ncbi:MAG TPA: hypothetical protein VLH56_03495 [Dissulfurispiraceae bacterium]|nr:hypothetical protein [Dissulfurispiraceae bacterium]